MSAGPSPWLVRFGAGPGRLRLCCFPFGGGGAAAYFPWRRALPDAVELVAVRLPGRESRIREPCLRDGDRVVEAIAGALALLPELPTVYFGHSLGAALAMETAHWSREAGRSLPLLLIASGRLPPHLTPITGWALRDDEALVGHLLEMGGVPPELAAEDLLLRMALPRLRADYALNDALAGRVRPPMPFPITLINGAEDPLAPRQRLAEWAIHTQAAFRSYEVPGGHFAIKSQEQAYLDILLAELDRLLV